MAVEDVAGHDLEDMGPVDYVLIEFPDGQPKGQAAPLLLDLVDRGLIRILDLMFISKDEDGTTSAVEIADIDGDGKPDFMVFEGASSGLLGDEDSDEAGNAMEPDTAAAADRVREPLGGPVREGDAGGRRPARRVRPHPSPGPARLARGRRDQVLRERRAPCQDYFAESRAPR